MTTIEPRRRGWWEVPLVIGTLVAGLLVLAAGLFAPRGVNIRQLLFPSSTDGSWMAVAVDGRPVTAETYRVSMADGQVGGGRDGCNDWSFDDSQPPGRDGSRAIVSTLAACAETPTMRAFRSATVRPKAELMDSGQLRLSSFGHTALFVRCEWKDVDESGPGYYSKMRRCLPSR